MRLVGYRPAPASRIEVDQGEQRRAVVDRPDHGADRRPVKHDEKRRDLGQRLIEPMPDLARDDWKKVDVRVVVLRVGEVRLELQLIKLRPKDDRAVVPGDEGRKLVPVANGREGSRLSRLSEDKSARNESNKDDDHLTEKQKCRFRRSVIVVAQLAQPHRARSFDQQATCPQTPSHVEKPQTTRGSKGQDDVHIVKAASKGKNNSSHQYLRPTLPRSISMHFGRRAIAQKAAPHAILQYHAACKTEQNAKRYLHGSTEKEEVVKQKW
jgi:hypothetical protein